MVASLRQILRPAMSACLAMAAGCAGAAPDIPVDTGWRDLAGHQNRRIVVNGAALDVLDWGGTGAPLVLVHGTGDNAHIFDDLVPSLGDGFRVIAYTRRGHGKSGKVGPYDTMTLTEDLRVLLDSLGLRKAHLGGWSSGGNELTAFAQHYPDRVDRLVYLDAAYDWSEGLRTAFRTFPIDITPPPATRHSYAAFRAWQMRNWFPNITDTTRAEAYIRGLVVERDDSTLEVLASDSMTNAMLGSMQPRRYERIQSPILAIYAESYLDTLGGDPAQRAKNAAWEREAMQPFRTRSREALLRAQPATRVLTVAGAHGDFVLKSRDEVARAVREFLGSAQ